MSKLWTVEIALRYTLVVYAANALAAEEIALDNYEDACDPEREVHPCELHPGDKIPQDWATSEPYYGEEWEDVRDAFPEVRADDALTVQVMLDHMAHRQPPPRCDQTIELFDDKPTQVTNDRRDQERKA
jgi:hypothetical protein